MPDREPPHSDEGSRVIGFRRRQPIVNSRAPSPPAADDLAKYERGENPDDYRHRMVVNVVAFAFVIALIAAGLWLADTMAAMRKNQDCVLSGRRGCTPVEVTKDRW
jgi:hypothetical protein